ncbi:MAG: TolC family protein [Gammaproteobacteria bacterium]|nr:TolC family protein [Gammaproteobacteria bacterium]
MKLLVKQLLLFISSLAVFSAVFSQPLLKLPYPTRTISYIKKPIKPKKLSLKEAVFLALRFNPDVKNAEIQRALDKFDLELKYWAFTPHYKLTGSANYTYGQKPQYDLTPEASLNTPIGTTIGAKINNQLVGSESPSVDLSVTQPLLRGFGTQVNKDSLDLHNQIDQEIINKLTLKSTVMQTVVKVISQYLTLAQDYNTLDIYREQLKQLMKTYEEYQIKIKAGKMPPREIVQQESNIAQQKYTIQDQLDTLQRDYHTLLATLGLRDTTKIRVDRNVVAQLLPLPNAEKSKKLALDNNVGYRQSLLAVKQARQNFRYSEDQQRWELNLKADATVTNGRLIKGVGQDITSQSQSSRSVGLELDIPIDDMSLKETLMQDKVALEKQRVTVAQTRRQSQIDVSTQLRSIDSAKRQIQQAYLTAKLAKESYEIERIKWSHSRSSNIDLNTALGDVTQAQNNIVFAKISYLNALAQFQETIGTLLDAWQIHIRY